MRARPTLVSVLVAALAVLALAAPARAQFAPPLHPYPLLPSPPLPTPYAPPRHAPGLLDDLSRGALLLHGNYCGPGNRAPWPPIDPVDAACARHDSCTPPRGLPSCACNARLRAETAFLSRSPSLRPELRAVAGTVSAVAALLPCAPR